VNIFLHHRGTRVSFHASIETLLAAPLTEKRTEGHSKTTLLWAQLDHALHLKLEYAQQENDHLIPP
jgi:hypothetical protein